MFAKKVLVARKMRYGNHQMLTKSFLALKEPSASSYFLPSSCNNVPHFPFTFISNVSLILFLKNKINDQ